MTNKVLKYICLSISGLSLILGVAGNIASDKKQSLEMSEMIDEKLNERLGTEPDSEEEIES